MVLNNISIKNYRCFENLEKVPIHKLTVFIGENDAGKTCILDALEILLTSTNPTQKDFFKKENEEVSEEIVIEGNFLLESHDSLSEDFCSIDNKSFIIRKTFSVENNSFKVFGRGYSEPRWNNFSRLSAQDQKELLHSVKIVPEGNSDKRIEQFSLAVAEGLLQKESMWLDVRLADINDFLPRFEKVSSIEYLNPDSMVQRTLQSVVDSFIRPENPETGERELRKDLQNVKFEIEQALNAKTEQMVETLQHVNPRLVSIEVSPTIDFSKSVTTQNLLIDQGNGHQFISSYGEGTKKKLWMGLLDWQKATQSEYEDISVIRVYDEPDVNLDYAAERKLFSNIFDSTRNEKSRTQAIICTHAVTLVDRAPGDSINLISVSADGKRQIEYLDTHEKSDSDVEEFLSTIGRSVGLSNSSLFYERAFLVVEGESEENALPILYKNLYGRSFIEDGIVLIPLFTCGAWKSILSVLHNHRETMTVLLLDNDCLSPESCAKISMDSLEEIGFSKEYFDKNGFFIGNKEFEDAFSTNDIVSVLNRDWPKEDGSNWLPNDVDEFRKPSYKFSSDLLLHVTKTCIKPKRNHVRKPEFALALAKFCKDEYQVPSVIKDVFIKLRETSEAT